MAFEIWNRRYTGSKLKLQKWIFEIINSNCKFTSFCEIFAGTGVISQCMLDKVDNLIVNDFLYSNEIIYRAFFEQATFDKVKLQRYCDVFNSLNSNGIKPNYVSSNYGDKYFKKFDALKIGEIRERIEQAIDLNEKERSILIASLLYSVDKIANTVGHYDAYIKGKQIKGDFYFDLITPYITKTKVDIHREDANILASSIEADVVYIDPPYNSRQYSRFYHVLENITTWQKPDLYGEAMKPMPENMSDYCRSNANVVFDDLVSKLKCKYIVVSYNNTYNSKSSSSKNKMTLEQIEEILSKKGKVKKFEKAFNAFNAGKTNLENHKEILFLVEVNHKDTKKVFLRSPFFYVGDKFKLVPQLLDNFPNNINTFVEPFCGGGSVFLNVDAKTFLVNDIDENIVHLHEFMLNSSKNVSSFWENCVSEIQRYGLSASYLYNEINEKLKLQFPKTYFAHYNKLAYARVKQDFNKNKNDMLKLYLLLIYGFNRMLRFNAKGDFNLPVGNVDFNSNVAHALNGYFNVIKTKKISFYSLDFERFLTTISYGEGDFIYLDPPYLITFSEYNKLWTEESEQRLLNLLDELNLRGVKFAVSNIVRHKGRYNLIFDEWAKKYDTVTVKSNYISFHDNTAKGSLEVLVKNY